MYLKDPKIKSILIEINENFKDQHSSILKLWKKRILNFIINIRHIMLIKIKIFFNI